VLHRPKPLGGRVSTGATAVRPSSPRSVSGKTPAEFRELPVGDRELGDIESAERDLPHRAFAIGREGFEGLAPDVAAGGVEADHIFERPGSSARARLRIPW